MRQLISKIKLSPFIDANSNRQHVGGMRLALVQKKSRQQSSNLETCAPLLAELAAKKVDDKLEARTPPAHESIYKEKCRLEQLSNMVCRPVIAARLVTGSA